MTPDQFRRLDELLATPVPPTATQGRAKLISGEQLEGRWVFFATATIAAFLDNNGRRWFIDMEKIVGFSPNAAAPLLMEEPNA